MAFEDKYKLDDKQSVFLAKKMLVDSIYSGVRLEGVNATFPETKCIVEGHNVAKLSVDDILVIRNLRNAWRYLLSNIDAPVDLEFACKINDNVSYNESLAWGILRNGNVNIGGTDYIPPLPNSSTASAEIDKVMTADKSTTEKAIDYYLYGCRSQLFWDGNKRTSWIIANKIMIDGGAGILLINDSIDMQLFNVLLSEYYATDKRDKLKKFLYDNCICGLDIK